MMQRLTKTHGDRLCELVHLMRPGWDIPGIAAAVRDVADGTDGREIASALFALAARDDVQTPGLLRQRGSWWPQAPGMSGPRQSVTTPCHIHPTEPAAGCQPCAEADARVKPMTDEERSAIRAEIRAAIDEGAARLAARTKPRTTPTQPKEDPK